jgi:glutamate-1-semialdehyde aminotransferase
MVQYLIDHEAEVYPRIAALGGQVRRAFESAFTEEGIPVQCTGDICDVLSGHGSSAFMPHFPRREDHCLITPEDVYDPTACHIALSQKALQLALLLENVHLMHGHGAVSLAHTEADIAFLDDACRRVARRFKPYL